MSSIVHYSLIDHHYSACRRMGGFSLRGIAWVVLVSWLFTFLVCSVVTSGHHNEIPASHTAPAAFAHIDHVDHADNHAQHDDGSSHADACCTLLENLSAFTQANNIQIPLHHLVLALLPADIALQAVVPAILVKIEFFATGPPGKSNHALIAHSLWPNAPPR